jgi:hypothetical protein
MAIDEGNRKLRHRTQLFLTDEQYRWLKVKAGDSGSIAAVVRDWIDSNVEPGPDQRDDPFIRWMLEEPGFSNGIPSSVETIDEEIYG